MNNLIQFFLALLPASIILLLYLFVKLKTMTNYGDEPSWNQLIAFHFLYFVMYFITGFMLNDFFNGYIGYNFLFLFLIALFYVCALPSIVKLIFCENR